MPIGSRQGGGRTMIGPATTKKKSTLKSNMHVASLVVSSTNAMKAALPIYSVMRQRADKLKLISASLPQSLDAKMRFILQCESRTVCVPQGGSIMIGEGNSSIAGRYYYFVIDGEVETIVNGEPMTLRAPSGFCLAHDDASNETDTSSAAKVLGAIALTDSGWPHVFASEASALGSHCVLMEIDLGVVSAARLEEIQRREVAIIKAHAANESQHKELRNLLNQIGRLEVQLGMRTRHDPHTLWHSAFKAWKQLNILGIAIAESTDEDAGLSLVDKIGKSEDHIAFLTEEIRRREATLWSTLKRAEQLALGSSIDSPALSSDISDLSLERMQAAAAEVGVLAALPRSRIQQQLDTCRTLWQRLQEPDGRVKQVEATATKAMQASLASSEAPERLLQGLSETESEMYRLRPRIKQMVASQFAAVKHGNVDRAPPCMQQVEEVADVLYELRAPGW
eukprot:4724079-Prymnesium_polylepis.1